MSKITSLSNRRIRRSSASYAFSLVEVVLAMGVLSFALVTVFGLVPVGLDALHKAMAQTAQTAIVQQINSQALVCSYSTLNANYSPATYYYDDEGYYLTNSTSASPNPAPNNTRFYAMTSIVPSAFPGSSSVNATTLASSIKAIQIVISTSPNLSAPGAYPTTNIVQIPNCGN